MSPHAQPSLGPACPRAVDRRIPASREMRDALRALAREYVDGWNPTPPQPLHELRLHAEILRVRAGAPPEHSDYLAVLLNNEVWRGTVAAVPFRRRLLLLPKCLRPAAQCPAAFDAVGLLCQQCGLCVIGELQREAERLGYAVLVAEGSAVVMSAIRTGQIEAIIGVSCLSVLEKAFPHMETGAVPGIAIPLLQEGCADTSVDLEWVQDALHLDATEIRVPIDISTLRQSVATWFQPDDLDMLLGAAEGDAETVARAWLSRSGKRWRPTLTAATHRILAPDTTPDHGVPEPIRRIAVAVECFHKASLVHDDIADDDPTRYGEPTLARQHGVGVALNAGDLLIGEGYRLIAEAALPHPLRAELARVAARGQRALCRGQGAELAWQREPRPLSSREVIAIYEGKTAPAFDVALQFGARAAGAPPALLDTLSDFSRAIGIAYQIRDDLDDLAGDTGPCGRRIRPGLILALALEEAETAPDRATLLDAWRGGAPCDLEDVVRRSSAPLLARSLLQAYKQEAIDLLQRISDPNLKALLRRVVGKIFDQFQIRGWCREP